MAQKPLRIDDDVYTELERLAPIEGRSIANLASHLIREALKADRAGHLVSNTVHADQLPLDLRELDVKERHLDVPTPAKIENTPTSRDLYDLAKKMTEELEEELKYNQDPESRRQQEKVGKEQIQLVWDEYHELKSSEE